MKKYAVIQKNNFGCAVACVAFILKKTYEETLPLFYEGEFKSERGGFLCKDIVKVLNNLNFSYDYFYVKSRTRNRIYKQNSIVFIKRSKNYPHGHYLCRSGKTWMDSWINFLEKKDINQARAGFRKRLPGKAIYVVM